MTNSYKRLLCWNLLKILILCDEPIWVFFFNGLNNKTRNVRCTLILASKSNLYLLLNIHSTMWKKLAKLDMNYGVKPSAKIKFLTFKNTFLAHMVLYFLSSGIDILSVAFSVFSHNNLVIFKTCSRLWAKFSPSLLNFSVDCVLLRAMLVGWSASTT